MLRGLDICSRSGIGSLAFERAGRQITNVGRHDNRNAIVYTVQMGQHKSGKHQYGDVRQCATCGKDFRPRMEAVKAGPPRGLFCGRGCAVAAHNQKRRKHFPRPCAYCGNEFTPYRREMRCCSRSCGRNYSELHRKKDPMVKIRHRMAVTACSFVARCMRNKTDTTKALLGYSVDDLIGHIENLWTAGMSWENYGKQAHQWSVDHIKPISTFAPNASIKDINALSNLRPLWVPDNCSKSADRGERRRQENGP